MSPVLCAVVPERTVMSAAVLLYMIAGATCREPLCLSRQVTPGVEMPQFVASAVNAGVNDPNSQVPSPPATPVKASEIADAEAAQTIRPEQITNLSKRTEC